MANRAGYALGYDGGGNSYMAAAYLLRWDGPVAEADDPYAPYAAHAALLAGRRRGGRARARGPRCSPPGPAPPTTRTSSGPC